MARRAWTRSELLVALGLYLELPFGQLRQGNPVIVRRAELIGRTPSALAMKILNLVSLDDSIQRSGLVHASQADRALWAELQADWTNTAHAIAEANQALGVTLVNEDGSEPIGAGEEAVAETKVRRGQALFRAAVLSAYQNRCCITGLAEPRLLNASHIVPWREDPANRLNPRNGLCLSALHDRAFDRGLITFDAELRLLLSAELDSAQDRFTHRALGIYAGQPIERPEKFSPDPALLERHREQIFVGA